jgi:DNA-directed RNA polymerase I and III subunit RPAC1
MVHDDIILCKLRPGQAIEVTCFCHKGVGKDHAKFSPVATASYRLRPDIQIVDPFLNDDAERLVGKCPMKVFDIEDLGKGQRRARVANADNCSMCRECIRDPADEKRILLQRIKNHYIFSIESTGALKPYEIFEEAVKEFLSKIDTIRSHLSKAATTNTGSE